VSWTSEVENVSISYAVCSWMKLILKLFQVENVAGAADQNTD